MPRIEYSNFLEGADVMLSPFLMADNKLEILDNCLISYKLGTITKRPGYSKVGDTLEANKSITGLHNFRQSSSVQKILATVNNSTGANLVLAYNNAGTWADISVGTTYDTFEDAKTEFEDFIGYCFIVGYDSTDSVFLPVGSLTGTTFSTSTNVTSMPQGKYIIRYRDRLYVLNAYYSAAAYPYRAYYSSVPVAGAITWTPATDFIDVDYSEQITGAGVNWDRLIMFTEYSAYMFDQLSKRKVWDIGCSNHRTIKNAGAMMIWANRDGVWISTGGRPENVAGRVLDFIKAGNPLNFFAEVVDEEYHLYVGTVTVNGITYTNTTLIFNIPTGTWRWHEYSDNMTVFAAYNSSGILRLYMGAADGDVHDLSKYTDTSPVWSDNTAAIQAFFRTKPFNFGMAENYKGVKKMYAFTDRAQGLNIKMLVKDKNAVDILKPQKVGQLTKFITETTPALDNAKFVQFEGVENSTNAYFSLYGFVFDVELATKKR